VKIKEIDCIKCCCCQEFCPVGAIALQDVWSVKLLRNITSRL
jgi:formate hydrogenlyase subunit 6/NADH:ubiquinone oxidoreductase subunit I